jgi:hydrogenase/urease accessory protein HupE
LHARGLGCVAAALLCLTAWPAFAHTAGTIGFATIAAEDSEVRYELVLGLPSIPAPLAAALDLATEHPDLDGLQSRVAGKISVSAANADCRPASSAPPLRKGDKLIVPLRFSCSAAAPAELVLRDDLADLFGADYHTLANVTWPGGNSQFMFQPDRREMRVTLARRAAQGVGSFFALGVQHILIGYDHLLFLLALILRGGNLWSLLRIITAFTIAHTITLALAALNILVLPSRLVEGVIALSIAYVAAENLFARRPASHRWVVSFVFGLVHGVGFSSVLREIGLPREGLLWSLLSFNLGVEAGQAVAVLATLPLLMYLRRTKYEPQTVVAMSVLVLVVGLALFVDRTVFGLA